jgi:hypothetical protein
MTCRTAPWPELYLRDPIFGAILVNIYLKMTQYYIYKRHEIESFMAIAGKTKNLKALNLAFKVDKYKICVRVPSRLPVALGEP